MREKARLHVSLAGEVAQTEWQAEVRAYWRQHVAESDEHRRKLYAEFAVVGILPDWAAGEDREEWLRQGRERLLRAGDAATPTQEREAMARSDPFWVVRAAALLNPALSKRERIQRIKAGCFGVPTLVTMWQHGEFVSPERIRDQCRRALLRVSVKTIASPI